MKYMWDNWDKWWNHGPSNDKITGLGSDSASARPSRPRTRLPSPGGRTCPRGRTSAAPGRLLSQLCGAPPNVVHIATDIWLRMAPGHHLPSPPPLRSHPPPPPVSWVSRSIATRMSRLLSCSRTVGSWGWKKWGCAGARGVGQMCGCRAHSGSDCLHRHAAPGGGSPLQAVARRSGWEAGFPKKLRAAGCSGAERGGATNCLNLELLSYPVGAKPLVADSLPTHPLPSSPSPAFPTHIRPTAYTISPSIPHPSSYIPLRCPFHIHSTSILVIHPRQTRSILLYPHPLSIHPALSSIPHPFHSIWLIPIHSTSILVHPSIRITSETLVRYWRNTMEQCPAVELGGTRLWVIGEILMAR